MPFSAVGDAIYYQFDDSEEGKYFSVTGISYWIPIFNMPFMRLYVDEL